MLKPVILILMLLILCGCKSKFDKKLWVVQGDVDGYPYRNDMVDDLVKHHKLRGLTYRQLVDSLGNPNNSVDDTSGIIYYDVKIDYGWDIDPVYVKSLRLMINKDSIVTGVDIKEWKH
ncbi:hypothetical protein C8P68_102758 [Mucilaginibacter yixingensis]|uniref:Uncharacterized protein n=1 Tax=Mucilaginibacter yixingensis TaxID=1295612 RepID=A0A2T5JDT8_9SPHI|nr:hypothetical protein [Mucilaginibacter yixingensis]PTQ99928.1 hypothetical protein C8P68_102758 [Mucilaginibacter yixingensis]